MAKKKRKDYLQIFIYITLCIVGTLSITSVILYVNFENIALKQIYADDMEILLNSQKGVTAMTGMATTLANQIYNDFQVSRLRYYKDPAAGDLRAADIQLTNYRLSMPFIDSVYIYNGMKQVFYINATIERDLNREAIQKKDSFDDPFASYMIDNFTEYKPFIPIPRRFIPDKKGEIQKNYYTFFQYDAFLKEDIASAVIVNISESWVAGLINQKTGISDSSTFIINRQGEVISSTGLFSILRNVSDDPFIGKIRRQHGQGTFIDSVNSVKSVVSFTAPDQFGHQYIKVTPSNIIFSKLDYMKKFTIFLSVGLLVFGIVLSFLTSRRLYRPLQKLLTEKRSNAELLKQVLFRDIFTGRGSYDRKSVKGNMEQLGLSCDPEGWYRILLVRIDRYSEFCREFQAEGRVVFREEINAAVRRIFSSLFRPETVEMGDDGIAVVLDAAGKGIRQLAEKLQTEISRHLDATLTIAIGDPVKGILNLHESYQRTVEAASYKLFYGHGSIISAHLLPERENSDYRYPSDCEKQLISQLMSGNISEAKNCYDRIIAGTEDQSVNAFRLALSRLAFALIDAIKTIKRNNNIVIDLEKNLSLAVLNRKETVDEINLLFHKTFDELHDLLADRKKNRGGKLVSEIDQYISANYQNPSLYIELIAEVLNKSPTYISHVYKQFSGKTILDRIIEIRMEQARQMLLETKLPISEIAEKTGFASSSYFFKVFKKINGATPVSFKKNINRVRKVHT